MGSYKLDPHRAAVRLGLSPAQGSGGTPARRWAAWAAAAGVAALGLWWWGVQVPSEGVHLEAARAGVSTTPASPAIKQGWLDPNLGTGSDLPDPIAVPARRSSPSPAPAASSAAGIFELDAAGRLRLDERMRLKMENLVVLTPPEQLAERLDKELATLPAHAAAAARDLVTRYQNYAMAEKLAYPTAAAPLVPEEGLTQLAELRALRETHFGREAARRLYGEEEAVTRRLLELMRDDPVPHASMEEKAMRAQARYDAERLAPKAASAGR
ncbi:MAG: hypothetical protein HY855_19235 [Burkholderiales bacterium]|nr:hypothetical protein [Burkholderiales bacterium]